MCIARVELFLMRNRKSIKILFLQIFLLQLRIKQGIRQFKHEQKKLFSLLANCFVHDDSKKEEKKE